MFGAKMLSHSLKKVKRFTLYSEKTHLRLCGALLEF